MENFLCPGGRLAMKRVTRLFFKSHVLKGSRFVR